MSEEALNQETETAGDAQSVVDFLYSAQNQGEEASTEDVSESQVEPTPEPEGDEQEELPMAAEAEEGENVSSVSELIEHLEADPEWFDDLKVPITVNGKPAEATFKEMVASYQTQEAANDRLEAAKTRDAQARQEADAARAKIQEDVGAAAALALLVKQSVFGQEAQALEALKDSDGEQYLIKKDELAGRVRAFERVEAQIRAKLEEAQKPSADVMSQEREKLLQAMPGLESEEASTALFQYITESGFTADQIEANPWHQLYVFAEKARLYDEQQAKSGVSRKKLAKIPKIVKPSQPQQPPAQEGDHAAILYGNN